MATYDFAFCCSFSKLDGYCLIAINALARITLRFLYSFRSKGDFRLRNHFFNTNIYNYNNE